MEGVDSIYDNMFASSSALVSVEMPSTLKTIGNNAFTACNSIKEIVLPEGVVSIGDLAFASCSKLERVVIPSSVSNIGSDIFKCLSGNVTTPPTIVTTQNSVAHTYAESNGIPYEFIS